MRIEKAAPTTGQAECFTCGVPVIVKGEPGCMCDRNTRAGRVWCAKCFQNKPCGRGEHGEGCPTMVFSDEPARSPEPSDAG